MSPSLVTNSLLSFFFRQNVVSKIDFFIRDIIPFRPTTNKEFFWLHDDGKNEAETFVHHRGSVSREGRKAHLVDELETTSVFDSLILDLDGGHRQSRGGVQGDDGRGDEGDALWFFFQFLSRKRRAFRLGKEKEAISGEWKRPRDDANATQNANRTTVKRERASLLFESTRTFSFSSSRVGVLVADRCAIEIKRAKIPSEIFVFWTYLLGEFVGRLDADDNLLGLLGGRFDRNQVGGERWS